MNSELNVKRKRIPLQVKDLMQMNATMSKWINRSHSVIRKWKRENLIERWDDFNCFSDFNCLDSKISTRLCVNIFKKDVYASQFTQFSAAVFSTRMIQRWFKEFVWFSIHIILVVILLCILSAYA